MISSYRDVVGLKPITDKAAAVGFITTPANIVHMMREPDA
jgi:hypothetical protein